MKKFNLIRHIILFNLCFIFSSIVTYSMNKPDQIIENNNSDFLPDLNHSKETLLKRLFLVRSVKKLPETDKIPMEIFNVKKEFGSLFCEKSNKEANRFVLSPQCNHSSYLTCFSINVLVDYSEYFFHNRPYVIIIPFNENVVSKLFNIGNEEANILGSLEMPTRTTIVVKKGEDIPKYAEKFNIEMVENINQECIKNIIKKLGGWDIEIETKNSEGVPYKFNKIKWKINGTEINNTKFFEPLFGSKSTIFNDYKFDKCSYNFNIMIFFSNIEIFDLDFLPLIRLVFSRHIDWVKNHKNNSKEAKELLSLGLKRMLAIHEINSVICEFFSEEKCNEIIHLLTKENSFFVHFIQEKGCKIGCSIDTKRIDELVDSVITDILLDEKFEERKTKILKFIETKIGMKTDENFAKSKYISSIELSFFSNMIHTYGFSFLKEELSKEKSSLEISKKLKSWLNSEKCKFLFVIFRIYCNDESGYDFGNVEVFAKEFCDMKNLNMGEILNSLPDDLFKNVYGESFNRSEKIDALKVDIPKEFENLNKKIKESNKIEKEEEI